jgi:hypothetical protein
LAAKSSKALWKETTAIAVDVAKEGPIAHKIYGLEFDHCKVKV